MKKFLVLTLVLGVASLASAGVLTAGLEYEVDTVAKTITITGTDLVGFSFGVLQADAGAVSGIDTGLFTTGGTGSAAEDLGLDYAYGVGALVGASGSDTSGNGITGVAFTLGYDAGATTITILPEDQWGLGDASASFKDGSSVDLTGFVMNIPEPATLALLGLGALVLRRKK